MIVKNEQYVYLQVKYELQLLMKFIFFLILVIDFLIKKRHISKGVMKTSIDLHKTSFVFLAQIRQDD